MGVKKVNDSSLTLVADEIRAKGGTSEPLTFPQGFVLAIRGINTGEENVIEIVKVNGTALTPDANKAVDVEVPIVALLANDGTSISLPDAEDPQLIFVPTTHGMDVTSGEILKALVDKGYVDTTIATELENFEHQDYEIIDSGGLPASGESGIRYLLKIVDEVGPPEEFHYEEYLWVENDWRDCGRFDSIKEATETVAGVIKLNPSKNITLDADGKLEVGGRIGQFEGTTGLFAPNDRDPRNVGNYSFLITDAMGMDLPNSRSLAVVSGLGITCRSAAAGTTTYRIKNTYANRISAICCANGYAAKDEATSQQQRIVPIVSITIGGNAYTPDSSPDSSATADDIVIVTAETLNPDSAITNIRLFGKLDSYATVYAGNGISAGPGGGRNLLLGGGVTKSGSGNDNCLVGNGMYSSGNGNAGFGRYHIFRKNRGFFAGTGHDGTNGPPEGVSAVGVYSFIDASTLFAVGNGSSHTDRKNAFEVRSDGVVLKSPDGSRWLLSVDNSGNLSTTKL
jgi:hypothetical protein